MAQPTGNFLILQRFDFEPVSKRKDFHLWEPMKDRSNIAAVRFDLSLSLSLTLSLHPSGLQAAADVVVFLPQF